MTKDQTIKFFINRKSYEVPALKFGPEYKLIDFIRDEARLTGTKWMCREGGCGACVVSVKSKDAVTGQDTVKAINSCLTPLLSCNDWNIATVESLGSKKDGLHPIQKQLVHFNGSQCGFCTSGMVMSMHSLMESKKSVTSEDVEKNLDGNICRCTGYRPILDAFKSLSVDASEEIKMQCRDIEDCANCPSVFKYREKCSKLQNESSTLEFNSDQEWVKCSGEINGVLEALKKLQKTQKKYRLVAGNTGTGVYKHDGPYQTYLELENIPELRKWNVDPTGITLGAGVTLSETIQILNNASKQEGLAFGTKMAGHIERIANVPIRNRATIAGNLMLKHAHKDFPSDIFLLLETLATRIRIVSTDESPKMYTLLEFLNLDMYGKIILSVFIPQRKAGYHFTSLKISRRYQNALAYLNAGFLLKLDTSNNGLKIVEKPRIVFGGINNTFVHASGTEAYLVDKDLRDKSVLKGAIEALDKEMRPDVRDLGGTAEYRKILAKSLLYKAFLEILGEQGVGAKYASGSKSLERGLSSAKPEFLSNDSKDLTGLYGPVRKLEAPVQSTGEAEYINDIPIRPGELFAAYVLSTVGNATLDKIAPLDALKMPGVVTFIGARDIPNQKGNNSMPFGIIPTSTVEPIFAHEEISHAGQPLGLILAESMEVAIAAAKKVKVYYKDVKHPVVNIKEAFKNAKDAGALDKHIIMTVKSVDKDGDKEVGESLKHSVTGQFRIGGQAHFHMEPQSCICVPTEDGMDVFSGTQWMDHVQGVVAGALGVPTNRIHIKVRRIGGGFGAKLTKSSGVAGACAVAAYVTNRPVRLILDIQTNLAMIGKRPPYLTNYEVGFDEEGKIGKLKAEVFCDVGFAANEPDSVLVPSTIQNVYRCRNWEVKPGFLNTNTHANTWTRAPGTAQGTAIIEYIMEHIAHVLRKDSLEVRMNNLASPSDFNFPTANPIKGEQNLAKRIIDEVFNSGEYEARRRAVDLFNNTNRWKKRGMALVPVKFFADFFGVKYPVFVTINNLDGSVTVAHGGIEMGNGLNTKVAQTVAFTLDIPVEKVIVRPTDNVIGNNASFTGGSIGSELCCDAAIRACKILLQRLDAVRETMENKNPSWEELVRATFTANIDLSALYMHGPNDGVEEYNIWLANITEVEIDVLTGENKVVRVDIVEDTGKSLNPAVDIGQIEGGYVMGQGLWTTEKLTYDGVSGRLLTDRSWTYKVPESKDIPEDFRVKLFGSVENPKGVLGSKATGEPPLCSSVCVFFALKNAIDSARRDAGNTDWYEIESPLTPEDIVMYCLTSEEDFTF